MNSKISQKLETCRQSKLQILHCALPVTEQNDVHIVNKFEHI